MRDVQAVAVARQLATLFFTLFLLALSPGLNAQIIIEEGTIRANFGIDADVKSDTLQDVSYAPCPVPGCDPAETDDWFYKSGGTGIGVINETNATAINALIDNSTSHNVTFTENLSTIPFAIPNGHVLLDAVQLRDNHSTGSQRDSSVFGKTKDKNFQNPATWNLEIGNTPQKNDIIDFFAHLRRDGENVNDDLWATFALSTRSADGSAYFDIEFFRSEIGYDPGTAQLINLGPDNGHTQWLFDNNSGATTQPGDVIVSIDFENGGSVITGHVYVWVNPNTLPGGGFATFNAMSNNPFNFVMNNNQWEFYNDGTSAPYGYAEIEANDGGDPVAFASLNSAPVSTGPWGTIFGSQANKVFQYPEEPPAAFGFNTSKPGLDTTTLEVEQCGALFGGIFANSCSPCSGSSSGFGFRPGFRESISTSRTNPSVRSSFFASFPVLDPTSMASYRFDIDRNGWSLTDASNTSATSPTVRSSDSVVSF
jgi:hypothetical protein